MAAKRVKRLHGRKIGEESERGTVDRISVLPDSLIYHILSFLPTTEVVRMSLLSRRWRRMWYSVPILNLSYIEIDRVEYFNKFVDNYLKFREIGMRYIADSSITRFKLKVPYCNGQTRVDKWLNFAVKNKVEELDLCIEPVNKRRNFYCLPTAILNAQSLTLLKLDRLKLEGPFQVSLPSLKLLSLKYVSGLSDISFEDLLANCPSLETLVVENCEGLSTPQVSSPSLKFLEVTLAYNQTIKFEAINLQSLHVRAPLISSGITLAACPRLKSLSLFNGTFDDLWLKDIIFGYALETLIISECYGWKHIKISSQDLKKLVISKSYYNAAGTIRINAPNLVSFAYKTRDIKSKISLNAPNLLVTNVILKCKRSTYNTSWYVKLLSLLSSLHCSKNMSLHVYSDKALIFPKILRGICRSSLTSLEHLKVKTYSPLSKRTKLRKAFYWLSPSIKSISMEQHEKGF